MAVAKKKAIIIALIVLAGALALVKFMLKPAREELSESKGGETGAMMDQDAAGTQMMPSSGTGNMMQPVAGKQVSTVEHYNNPAGGDDVGFTLTVDEQGTIVAAQAQVLARNPTSQMRQESFAAGFPQAVQGKKLADLKGIDRVGGSSLTTGAFNAALPKLKAEL